VRHCRQRTRRDRRGLCGDRSAQDRDWITDFTPRLSAGNLHTGFGDALETVWPRIRDALARPGALFFTGHSFGGALAIIAAERARRELNVRATGVYTYGSPRPGGAAFLDAYGEDLPNVTFRFVNGTDLVATVPPPLLSFHHVGRAIQCPTDGKFDLQAPTLSIKDDKPGFIESAFASGVADIITPGFA
jgi:triacylglycerol lipase